MIWDKWVIYDDGFVCAIHPDAPEEVKNACKEHLAEMKAAKYGGFMPK